MNDSDKNDGMKGSDLQQSQSGGGSGQYGGNQFQRQGGGSADDGTSGSSGSGGYGAMQNQQNQQGQAEGQQGGAGSAEGQSRGEAYDEAQGGGRGPGSVSSADGDNGLSSFVKEGSPPSAGADEIERDQQAHQDRGQSAIARDGDGG